MRLAGQSCGIEGLYIEGKTILLTEFVFQVIEEADRTTMLRVLKLARPCN